MSDETIAVSINDGLHIPEQYSQEILELITNDPQIFDKELTVDYTTLSSALESLNFWVTTHPRQGTQVTGYGRKLDYNNNDYPTMSISWKEYNPHRLIQALASYSTGDGGLYVEIDTQGPHAVFSGSPEPIWHNRITQYAALYENNNKYMITLIGENTYRSVEPINSDWDIAPMRLIETENELNEAWDAINLYSEYKKAQYSKHARDRR